MTSVLLNERRQAILDLIVDGYIHTAMPVASQQIARNSDLNVSSATIRNDMAELEELGYINRPHSSAGGVPIEPAYRFYVERHAIAARPSAAFATLVQAVIGERELDFDGLARGAAGVLSASNRSVAIASAPHVADARLKQLQLVHLHEHRALLVVVLESTQILQQAIDLPAQTTQAQLYEVANLLNTEMGGFAAQEMEMALVAERADRSHPLVTTLVANEAVRMVANAAGEAVNHPYVDGLRHLLGQPEFTDPERARQAVDFIEDEDVLRNLVADAPGPENVRVIIGRENTAEQLQSYSVITSRYGRTSGISGAIAVVGPTRLDYTQALASVRYLAGVLGALVGRLDRATD